MRKESSIDEISNILNGQSLTMEDLTPKVPRDGFGHNSTFASVEDAIFGIFKNSDGKMDVTKLYSALAKNGIMATDPRISEFTYKIRILTETDDDEDVPTGEINSTQWSELAQSTNLQLIIKTLQRRLKVADWEEFCSKLQCLWTEFKPMTDGENAQYIPQLARVDSSLFGIAVCTVDGQRCTFGECEHTFCLQSVSKAFTYAIALNDLGADEVHKYIGTEPSGRLFNEICLDQNNKPHNPMINAGAILCASLPLRGRPSSERFDYMNTRLREIAGGGYIGFNNAVFLSERETAWRNFALAYFMRENKCFPDNIHDLKSCLDFYFQLCSVETNADTLAVMAATLANGGTCSITGKRVLSNESCRHTLSLMHSCGMYDYSGMFAFKVGLPAKSGISGSLILAVPNIGGISIFSPPLDRNGNSVRGVKFCEKMVNFIRFNSYDGHEPDSAVVNGSDPCKASIEQCAEALINILFAAKAGDISAIKRYSAAEVDLDAKNYDGRTALHVAASEGQAEVLEYLLSNVKNKAPLDRWNHTPLDDSINFGHPECRKIIESYLKKASPV